MRIRKATSTDAPALSALALRSKAHWGYSAELLSLWSEELEISADFIHQNPGCLEVVNVFPVFERLLRLRVNNGNFARLRQPL